MGHLIDSEKFFANKDLTYSKDNLTGLLNRETVLDYINYLLEIKRPFSYLICDIDNFKLVNDSLGHIVGDTVLKQAANGLMDIIGDDGIVGRFGGDEFLLVVPDIIEHDEIWKVCRRVMLEMNHLEIKELKGNNITVTIGMSRYPTDGEDYNSLMEKADKALYRGKQKSRNCFIIYLPEKHANIQISDSSAKKFNSMDMHVRISKMLTRSDDIKDNLKALLNMLSSALMIDYICVQSKTEIVEDVVHSLAKVRDFSYIDNDILKKTISGTGYCFVNDINIFKEIKAMETFDSFNNQHVTATFFVEIEAYGQTYGFIRADSVNPDGRIWQEGDMDLLIMFANMLGVILCLKKTDLHSIV